MPKSIVKNTLFNVAYKLLDILFPLVTSIYLARVLGPIYIGKVSYGQSILSYFTVVASLGIPIYGTREIAKAGNNRLVRDRVFSELFIINFCATLVCSLAYTFMVFCVDRFRDELPLYMCLGLALYINVFNLDWFFTGQEEYVYITVRSSVVKILSLFAIFIFVNEQEHYYKYALIISAATIGNYLWNVLQLSKRTRLSFLNLDLQRHFKPVIILLVTMLATDLYNQIDVTMLGALRSEAEVGCYSNGIKLVRVVTTITTTVSSTILPRMCLLFKECKENDYKQLFWKTARLVLMLALPCATGIFLVAKPLVLVFFGEQFALTASVIRYLAPIILIVSLSYLIGSVVLTSSCNEMYLLVATLSGAFVNIILNSVLIPPYGTTGAALASVIGEFAVLIIHAIYGWKYVKDRLQRNQIKNIVVSCVGMGIVVIALRKLIITGIFSLVIPVAAGIVVYFVLLFAQHDELIKSISYRLRTKMSR